MAEQYLQEGLERARNLERPLFEGEREAGNMFETRDVRGVRAVEYLPRRASGGFQVSSVFEPPGPMSQVHGVFNNKDLWSTSGR